MDAFCEMTLRNVSRKYNNPFQGHFNEFWNLMHSYTFNRGCHHDKDFFYAWLNALAFELLQGTY